ncbi:MAG: exopolysaccharide biosynthesis protein [Methylotenera sp.]|nr:exopolysaccharide biosynthesis protein [Methylotenera sp.]
MSVPMNHYDDLVATLNLFATPVANEPLIFGDAMDKLDHKAYTFTATLAVLPFLQPIPLGIFALIGSAAFIALGVQLFKGEQTLALPQKIRAVALNLRMRKALVNTCLKIIGFCRRFTKPRLSFLVKGKLGQQIGGFIFIAVGILVAIPLGGVVPFKNLFPSLAVLFYCTGEIEHDGLMAVFALICLVLTVIFYGLLIYMAWKFGAAAINHFFWK